MEAAIANLVVPGAAVGWVRGLAGGGGGGGASVARPGAGRHELQCRGRQAGWQADSLACVGPALPAGETVVVGNIGIWGSRVCDMAERFGAKVHIAG